MKNAPKRSAKYLEDEICKIKQRQNITITHSVHLPPPLSAGRGGGGGGGVELTTKFPKQRGLDRTSTFRGVVAGKEGVTFFRGSCNCHIRDRLKSEIFNDKTVCKQKYFSLS